MGITSSEPLFVLRVDAEANRVVVGPESSLYQDRLWAARVNYVAGSPPDQPLLVRADMTTPFKFVQYSVRPKINIL